MVSPCKISKACFASAYTSPAVIALRANPNVTAWRVFERRQRGGADLAGRYFFRIDRLQPLTPVGPPRTLVFLGVLDPVGERYVLDIVVGPVLIFSGRRRIDDARNMS